MVEPPSEARRQSDIATRQNSPALLRLLKARQWRWHVARNWQKAQLVLLILLPAAIGTVGAVHPPWKAGLSVVASLLALVDIAVIDRRYREAIKTAARMSEVFDTCLLHLDWNKLTTGKHPTPEEVDRASRSWDRSSLTQPLENWYAHNIDCAPLALSRAICQRTNLTYDRDLRRIYATVLTVCAALSIAVLLAVGVFNNAPVVEFLITWCVPVSPFLFWILRERWRQLDAINANGPVIEEAERLIDAMIVDHSSDLRCEQASRELQNAIFTRRSTTYLMVPGIYGRRRDDSEQVMRAAASFWLEKAGLGNIAA
ncbi:MULTISPECIES: S-4TM family putative pore-forming effector [Sphingosinicellaceae]|uniref:S-4TM family putative pore-forming effector n=1 Tax=Sphingosinicellaceae TaxID=2820280 RepID=UPI001C1DD7A9|nr:MULTISPECIES: S-4TM family putative pore-forming effector [Polymorphobacter]QYE35669.1 hypothetical protein KZX46_06750 [Polymorphobacter sp. PAMC 29334]UAJ10965.1 hypothetical protein KTC28_04420 [Polymorphobacter megasporae]